MGLAVAVDYSLFMVTRFRSERQRGATLSEATQLMVGETGLGVFTGAITSAGTFYALCISSFGQDQLNAFKQIGDFGLKSQMRIVAPQLVFTRRIAGGHEPYKGIVGATAYYWALEDSM